MVATTSGDPFLDALWRIQQRDGLTACQLAERVGLTDMAICRYRSGKRRPSFDAIRQIVRAYPELLGYLIAESPPLPRA